MSFSRWWTETVASIGDVVSLPLAALLMALVAGLVAAGWFWYPAWIPRRWPRWRWRGWGSVRSGWRRLRLRWRWRREPAVTDERVEQPAAAEELPDLPVEALASIADRLAAEGDYAGAVRERLRAMVRELVDRRVIEHRPGWTVTELAGQAGRTRPAVAVPIGRAANVFSELWYAQRPARPEHDAQMRTLADELHRALAVPAPAPRPLNNPAEAA